MATTDQTPVIPGTGSAPRLGRCYVGGRLLLGISVVVDERSPDVAEIALAGELCPASAPILSRMVDALIEDAVIRMHVDLEGLDLCTAAGADLFDRLQRQLRERGGSLELHGARGVVHRVLSVTQIPHDVAPSEWADSE